MEPSQAIPKASTLFKQRYQILKGDKELALFPFLAGLTSLVAAAALYGLYMLIDQKVLHRPYAPGSQLSIDDYIFIFIYYLAEYCILVYFNVALAACVLYRFQGGDPTFGYGISQANKRKVAILQYAALAAVVGVILRFIAEKLGWAGKIFAWISETTWSIATMFIAPVLITSDLSPIDAIKRSETVFIQTWGKAVKGFVGFSAIIFVGAIVFGALLGIVVASFEPEASTPPVLKFTGLLVAIGLFVLFIMVFSACSAIYRVALYFYATTKQVPQGFDTNLPAAISS